MPVDARWRAARRILAVRVDNLGDVLMTTPALAALASTCDDVHLTLLTSPAGASIAAHAPMVDEFIVHDVPWTSHSDAPRSPEDDLALIERLRAGRFDAAVIFTVCTQSALPAALVCRLAGIPLRLAHSRENPYDLLTDWLPDTEAIGTGMRHEVTRQLDLVGAVGFTVADARLRFEVHAADRREIRERLGDPPRPYLVVHPGASASSRRYPAERLGAAARAIAETTGCRVVVAGSASEQPLVDAVVGACGPGALAIGSLSLGALGALIAGAQLIVCNNSGPMHIAAAVGTPTVALYALTNPQHTPWAVRSIVLSHDVPCRHCLKSTCPQPHHGCLLGVTTQQVVDAGLRLLST